MKKALLVDDVKLFIELEKTLLANRSNLQLFTASSGPEAIDIHKKEKVDIILCDSYMPGMNGDEVCRIIRTDSELKNVSIIIITTNAQDIDMCLKAGANDVILKPINPSEFMQKVGKYINIPVRRDIRIPARIGVEGTPSRSFSGNTVNISISGVLIESAEPISDKSVGDTIKIDIFLPDSVHPISITGKVVRRVANGKDKLPHYGIQFMNIAGKDRTIIGEHIEKGIM